MRKLVSGASILLILIALYLLLHTVFQRQHVKSTPPLVVAASATPGPDMRLVSTAPTPDPTPDPNSTPVLDSNTALKPLNSRVVLHQPDQFRKGALSTEELSAVNQAIKVIPWSRNANPKAAADEDYAAIIKECKVSSVHDLLADVVTEAVSNDYQPNNEAANSTYFAELNSNFESGGQRHRSTDQSTGELDAGQVTGVESKLTPKTDHPDAPANATSVSPSQQTTSAEVNRPKIGHLRHRSTVRHQMLDVKTRLLALWHQSLVPSDKCPKKLALFWDGREMKTKKASSTH
jgi:hypothetical protein